MWCLQSRRPIVTTNKTKKIELMLTRRAKAYSSSGLRKVNIQIPNSSSRLHNANSKAPPCEWYRLVLQPEIAKKIHKTLYFGIQGHSRSLNSAPIESQCTTSYYWLIVTYALSRTVTEIQRLIGQKSQILPTPSHLVLSFGVVPFEFMEKLYGSWN